MILATALACALQIAQITFTPHDGYEVEFYNPSPRAVILTGLQVVDSTPAIANPADFPVVGALSLPPTKVNKISADWAVTVRFSMEKDPPHRRDPRFYTVKPICHDEKTEGNS